MKVPRRWPLIGHLPSFVRDKLGFLDACAATAGDVVQVDLGGPTAILKNAEDVRHVLEVKPGSYTKTPRLTGTDGIRLSGSGVLTSEGDRHARLRGHLHGLFTRTALAPLMDCVLEEAERTFAEWRRGTVRDVAADLAWLAKRVIGRMLFGADYVGADAGFAADAAIRKQYIQYCFDWPFPALRSLPLPLEFEYRAAAQRLRQRLVEEIRDRRRNPSKYRDLLAMLASVDDFSEDEVFDEALTLSITGYETIGEALAWTFYLLARHPAAADKVRGEGAQGGAFATACVAEAMRLYPPTWLFIRVARELDTLPSGATIQAGTKMYLSPWVVQRRAEYWPVPLAFRPERFLSADPDRPKLAYFPFGAGPRLCLGHHLAKIESAMILSLALSRFQFRPVSGNPPQPVGRITLVPSGGVRLLVE